MARAFDPFAPVAGLANVIGFRGAHVARFEPSTALDDLDIVIALADDLSGDVDLEDDGLGEPALGWECHGARGPETFFEDWTDARIYEARHCLDLEADDYDNEDDGAREDDGTNEPKFVKPHHGDQSHWSQGVAVVAPKVRKRRATIFERTKAIKPERLAAVEAERDRLIDAFMADRPDRGGWLRPNELDAILSQALEAGE